VYEFHETEIRIVIGHLLFLCFSLLLVSLMSVIKQNSDGFGLRIPSPQAFPNGQF